MPQSPIRHLRALSHASLTLTLAATGIHHIFRLGTELIPVTLAAMAVPWLLLFAYDRFRHWAALVAYAAYAALIVFWFGIVDGFMDHVLKVLGMENLTLLPGSEAEVVATVYALWSPAATYWFYEGSGVVSFLLSLAAAGYTVMFLAAAFRRRPVQAQ